MKKTREEMKELRKNKSKEFVKLLEKLKLNKKETMELNAVLKDYKKEKRRIRMELTEIVRVFENVLRRRDWKILKMRLRAEHNLKLHEIATIYGVTRERIRQIEGRALFTIIMYKDK